MVFEPHIGRLAPRHQSEVAPPQPAQWAAPHGISVYAALIEGARLFDRRPVASIGLGLGWMAATAAMGLSAALLASMGQMGGGSGGSTMGLPVPGWALALGAATAAFAALGAPLLIGVYANGIASAREGRPTGREWLLGFRMYPASFTLGALIGVVTAAVGVVPWAGLFLTLPVGTYTWAALTALADRRRGPLDALHAAWALLRGRFWPLLLLNLVATVVGTLGLAIVVIGYLFTVPIMVFMLGAGYRDAVEAAGPAEMRVETDVD